MMEQRSAFISYKSTENSELAAYLYNYLIRSDKNVDVYHDEHTPSNQDQLSSTLREYICRCDNYIFLSTRDSLQGLLSCALRSDPTPSEPYYWVYFELSTAIREGKSIIPVFTGSANYWGEIQRLYRKLFRALHKSPYHIVCRDCGESTNERLCEKIETCLSFPTKASSTDLSDIYWVGTRLSDITGMDTRFAGYVVLFGEKDEPEMNRFVMCAKGSPRRVDHNDASDKSQDEYIEASMRTIVERAAQTGRSAKFMFYNPATAFRLGFDDAFIREHIVCLNDKTLIETVSNKATFREEMERGEVIPMLPIQRRTRTDCEYEDLLQGLRKGEFNDAPEKYSKYVSELPPIAYEDAPRFIVQAPVASGGSGTFILNESNSKYLLSSLKPRDRYLVSVYHTNNVPVNVHVLISESSFVLLPPSVQLEQEVESENKLLYKGADFTAYSQIALPLREQFEQQVRDVSAYLQTKGYRGVLGIDAIIHNGRVNILEVNARFQASTELINRAFRQRGWKTVQELNLDCFSEQGIRPEDIPHCRSVVVEYSNFCFSNEGHPYHDRRVYDAASRLAMRDPAYDVQTDGYDRDGDYDTYIAQSYLFRVVFPGNIASISEDGTVWINENITPPDRWLYKKIKAREMLAVKLALLIQGVNVEDSIRSQLRDATNNAVDLQFGTGKTPVIINSPSEIRHISFSPFDLKRSTTKADTFAIYYYGELLIESVGIFPTDHNQAHRCSQSGNRSYSEVAYLSTDRLRVHLTNACTFKRQGKGCRFCNIQVDKNNTPIQPEELREVVATYMRDKRDRETQDRDAVTLRHFLIGGQSLDHCENRLIQTASILAENHLPIYAMTLPLNDDTVRSLIDLGVTEYAYNIEIFDETCRKKYMPGKGVLTPPGWSGSSLDYYMERLMRTRQILNSANYSAVRKVVRSMVIVGLEPWKSMTEGIHKLIEIGVEPMLSVFRPLPDTDLEDLNAPPIRAVYDLYLSVSESLYDSSGVDDEELIDWDYDAQGLRGTVRDFRKLGPECPCCQNNTVSLPWTRQYAVIRREPLKTAVQETVFLPESK